MNVKKLSMVAIAAIILIACSAAPATSQSPAIDVEMRTLKVGKNTFHSFRETPPYGGRVVCYFHENSPDKLSCTDY